MGEFAFYRDQLWTAPELLRMTTRPINGTQKADVYSFAIMLQELMFRAEPYFIDDDPPECMHIGGDFMGPKRLEPLPPRPQYSGPELMQYMGHREKRPELCTVTGQ